MDCGLESRKSGCQANERKRYFSNVLLSAHLIFHTTLAKVVVVHSKVSRWWAVVRTLAARSRRMVRIKSRRMAGDCSRPLTSMLVGLGDWLLLSSGVHINRRH